MEKKFIRLVVFETPVPKLGAIKEILEFEGEVTRYTASEFMFVVSRAEKNNNYYLFESHLTNQEKLDEQLRADAFIDEWTQLCPECGAETEHYSICSRRKI